MWFIKEGEKKDNQQEDIKKWPFSKVLLVQESILIWLVTICCIIFAFICIFKDSYIELPWISALCSLPWASYAITANAYYKKSSAENTRGGIIFENSPGGMIFGAKESNNDEPVG